MQSDYTFIKIKMLFDYTFIKIKLLFDYTFIKITQKMYGFNTIFNKI